MGRSMRVGFMPRRFAALLLLACLAVRWVIKAEVGLFSRIQDEHTPCLRAALGVGYRQVAVLSATIIRLRSRLGEIDETRPLVTGK